MGAEEAGKYQIKNPKSLGHCKAQPLTGGITLEAPHISRVAAAHPAPTRICAAYIKSRGCPLCPDNLCKGAVLERWMDELKPARCVYIGDGGGDFCTATRLRTGDFVLARRAPHDGLLSRCRAQPEAVAAHVLEWDSSEDGAMIEAAMRSALDGMPRAPGGA